MADGWGPGDRFDVFDSGQLQSGTTYELGFGEHPHSRSDNNIYARTVNGSVFAFSGHRVQVRVELETWNYLKSSSLSGDEIRKGGEWTLWLNGAVVRKQFFRDPEYALLQIAASLVREMEQDPNLWREGDNLVGRRIYYGDVPAVVESIDREQGEIIVVPVEGEFSPPPYAIEDGPEAVIDWLADYGDRLRCRVDDSKIWWWRNG